MCLGWGLVPIFEPTLGMCKGKGANENRNASRYYLYEVVFHFEGKNVQAERGF